MACTQPKDSGVVTIHYVAETTCGVTPGTPTFIPLRSVSGNPVLTKESLQSAEQDGSREIKFNRLGSEQAAGDFACELSLTTYDDLLEAMTGGTWVPGTPEAAVSVTVAAVGKTFTRASGDFTTNVSVGDLVRFPGLTGNNAKVYRVSAVSALVITAAGVVDDVLADEGPTSTDVEVSSTLTIGTIRRTLTILINFPDSLGNPDYHIVRGVEITGLSMEISVNALVTLTFPTIGRTYEAGASLPAGSDFSTPATTTVPFSNADGRLLEGGSVLGFATSATLNHDTNSTAQFAIGSSGVAFVEKGLANSTISMSNFFTDNTLFNKFKNETETSLVMLVDGVDGAMGFDLPQLKYTAGAVERPESGANLQNLEAQATGSTALPSLVIRSLPV